MDNQWIAMLVIWAIVEIIQYLRKRPYPARMKTGAKWAFWCGYFIAVGGVNESLYDSNPWGVYAASFGINLAGVLLIYGMRVLIAKGWKYLRQKQPLG